jgi:hypothetical protein
MEAPNTGALVPLLRSQGLDEAGVRRVFQTFNAAAPAFREVVEP